MRSWGWRLAMAVLLAVPAGSWAEDYWSYSYKYLDVVAAGTSQYAINMAHNVDRLDRALRKILPLIDQKPTATHIYALADSELRRLGITASGTARYKWSGSDTTVVTGIMAAPDQYWGAYFGYAGGLLKSSVGTHYPNWMYIGVPAVFADTEFRGDTIRTGGIAHGLGEQLLHGGPLLPMSTFLTLRGRDLPGLPRQQHEMYQAESWYVAREFLVEGHYRLQFAQYLAAMAGGTAEGEAFTSSFKMSHEQLDKVLAQVMFDSAHVYILDVPDDPGGNPQPPRRLTTAEVKDRLDGLVAAGLGLH